MDADGPRPCSICGGELEAADAVAGSPTFNGAQYWDCSECGTIQLQPLPVREDNLAFESPETAAMMAETDDLRRDYFFRRLRRFGEPVGLRNRFLDIGCSTGRLLGLAQQAGWDGTGLEMSAALAEEAARHVPAARIMVGDIMAEADADAMTRQTYHAIAALDVIEHVLDPEGFVRRVFDLAEPGGKVLLQTPNAASLRARLHGGRWNMLIPEYHFHLFTPQSIRLLLEDAGFVAVSVTTVSGSGLERGFAAQRAAIKEGALALGHLGNALLVSARRPVQQRP